MGSTEIIRQPQFGAGRRHNDYGLGFYCTESESLAREWACSSLQDGFANHYTLDMSYMKVLNLNSEEYSILNWMTVLLEHRLFMISNPVAGKAMRYLRENFSVNVNAYDVVVGYRADDAYYDFAEAFLNNAITVEQLVRAMRLGKLGEQIVLKSKYAFDKIRFEGFSRAEGELYYPVRKARNDEAEQQFHSISNEEADGIYVIDIIRGGITNDDRRIPRSLPEQCDD